MAARSLVRGKPYYRLTFADPDFTIPSVESMIYIGDNIFEPSDPSGVTHHFQDTVSFNRYGYATEYSGPDDLNQEGCVVYSVSPAELGVSLLTLDEVVNELRQAQQRAVSKAQ